MDKKTNRKVNTVICDSFEQKLSELNACNYYNIGQYLYVIDLNKANKLLIDSFKKQVSNLSRYK